MRKTSLLLSIVFVVCIATNVCEAQTFPLPLVPPPPIVPVPNSSLFTLDNSSLFTLDIDPFVENAVGTVYYPGNTIHAMVYLDGSVAADSTENYRFGFEAEIVGVYTDIFGKTLIIPVGDVASESTQAPHIAPGGTVLLSAHCDTWGPTTGWIDKYRIELEGWSAGYNPATGTGVIAGMSDRIEKEWTRDPSFLGNFDATN